jgi:hypothetical protein
LTRDHVKCGKFMIANFAPSVISNFNIFRAYFLRLCLVQTSLKDYKNIDFNSDVAAMYSKLREGMALAFEAEYLRSYQKRQKTSLRQN